MTRSKRHSWADTVVLSAFFPRVDPSDPETFEELVSNVGALYEATPHTVRQRSRQWYGKVHAAVDRGIRNTSLTHVQGAALVAAVSPGMDWAGSNIPAFQEMHTLDSAAWEALLRGDRSAVFGTTLARAPGHALTKAARIYTGESVEYVLPRRSCPKTYSFAHNISHLDDSPFVTIDGRAHDIATNRMAPWQFSGRGIDSAASSYGKPTRYEKFEEVYREAGRRYDESPIAMQAVTWEGGKRIELAGGRKKGVARHGQPYIHRHEEI